MSSVRRGENSIMSEPKKNKKKKVKYIDDGRTIADMSPLGGGSSKLPPLQRSSLKEQAKTYFATVRLMLLPMFIVMAAICVIFGLLYLLFSLVPA